jgi:hypothetical protein
MQEPLTNRVATSRCEFIQGTGTMLKFRNAWRMRPLFIQIACLGQYIKVIESYPILLLIIF